MRSRTSRLRVHQRPPWLTFVFTICSDYLRTFQRPAIRLDIGWEREMSLRRNAWARTPEIWVLFPGRQCPVYALKSSRNARVRNISVSGAALPRRQPIPLCKIWVNCGSSGRHGYVTRTRSGAMGVRRIRRCASSTETRPGSCHSRCAKRRVPGRGGDVGNRLTHRRSGADEA